MRRARLPVYPLPKTAQSCKRFAGFHKLADEPKEDEERHGVRDSLLDWAAFKLRGEQDPTRFKVLEEHELCIYKDTKKQGATPCSETMDRYEGYYRRNLSPNKTHELIAAQVDTRLQTHTGINREWGTVQTNILYNREVFEEGMRFWGMVKLPDDQKLLETFEKFIKIADDEKVVRIGTGRTRGLGQVVLRVGTVEGQDGTEQDRLARFKVRLVEFDAALKKRANKSAGPPFYFALTLHSPLILCDDLLRYRGTIDAQELAKIPGMPSVTLQQEYQLASGRRVSGWQELWGTPRTNEYAIDLGSVFFFSSSRPLDNDLLAALWRIEEDGLGRRRSEGFGRIRISDPFHLEGELR